MDNQIFTCTPGKPAYLQIADWMERRIVAGEFHEDDKLPSERILCSQLGVARGTVKTAYQELQKRQYVRIVAGSGIYVNASKPKSRDLSRAESAVQQAIEALRALNLSHNKIAVLAQECAWLNLKEDERPRLAWIDCCPEMLHPVVREIEVESGFSVEPMLLHEVASNPGMLAKEHFQVIATTVEHFDELNTAAQGITSQIGIMIERVVLSLTAQTIAKLVSIQQGERVAVVHDSAVFFNVTHRYLLEFGLECSLTPISADCAEEMLFSCQKSFQRIILPPDDGFHDGVCEKVAQEAARRGIPVIHLRYLIDFGSLRRLKALAMSIGSRTAP